MDEDVEVSVTLNMAVYLQDSLACPTDEDGRAVFRVLVLKMLGLIVSLKPEGAAAVRLTRDELWLIQGAAKSPVTFGKERVGWAWLQEAARGLLHLEAQMDVHQAVMRHGEQAGDPEEGQEARKTLAEWPDRMERG